MEQGVFDEFDEGDEEIIIKNEEMQKEEIKQELTEPSLKAIQITHKMSMKKMKEYNEYFVKNELISLAESEGIKRPKYMKKLDILLELQHKGLKPKIPERIIPCKKCGNPVLFKKITTSKWWHLEEDGVYCEECKKEIEELNKEEKQVNLLGN